jgi:hypothetical protein
MRINLYGFENEHLRDYLENRILRLRVPNYRSIGISFNQDPKSQIPPDDFKVLLLWEPSVVMPWQYRKKNMNKFDLIIPFSPWRAANLGLSEYVFKSYEPYGEFVSPFSSRSRFVTMINASKFSSSPKSNYGLRRQVSRLLHKSKIDYVLYGPNWHMSKGLETRKRITGLKNSLRAGERISLRETTSHAFYNYPECAGPISEKKLALTQSHCSIVIENESDDMTEKVLDSLLSGCVTFYVGPNLDEYFPELSQTLIKLKPNARFIFESISGLTSSQLNHKKRQLEEYLSQDSKLNRDLRRLSPETQWQSVGNLIVHSISTSH